MIFDPKEPARKPNVIVAAEQSIDVKDAATDEGRAALNRLDYETWLPFAAKTYKISPNINDYLIVATPICPSDLPNRNGIGFPLNELTKFQPPPISRMAYKAWAGCPAHYEHRNQIHEDAYGVILDASLHKVSGYGGGKLWKVMGLVGIDKHKYPEMAKRVAEGDINTYSMGAYVDSFTCSYCKATMTEKQYCGHLHPKNEIDWKEFSDYDSTKHIAFRNAHGISPIEISLVESPAWVSALSDHILAR
jgi:hypothetical protein